MVNCSVTFQGWNKNPFVKTAFETMVGCRCSNYYPLSVVMIVPLAAFGCFWTWLGGIEISYFHWALSIFENGCSIGKLSESVGMLLRHTKTRRCHWDRLRFTASHFKFGQWISCIFGDLIVILVIFQSCMYIVVPRVLMDIGAFQISFHFYR